MLKCQDLSIFLNYLYREIYIKKNYIGIFYVEIPISIIDIYVSTFSNCLMLRNLEFVII